jgi:zinc protease
VSPRRGAPVTAVQVHVRGGSRLDPKGREGTAHMAGRLLDQGTARRSEQEIASVLEAAGGGLSGDATTLSGNIASAAWPLLCEILCDCLIAPTYPAREFARQKQRLLDRLLLERDDPRAQADQLFRRLVYGSHWLGRPQYGSLESVARIERRHLAAFHRANWVARRATIAVCGDVQPAAVVRSFERRLRGWDPGETLEPGRPELPERGVRLATFPAQRQQVHVQLGHLGIRRKDPDYPALVVMDHVLGTGPGFANRISRRLRDELGLAYSVHASIHSSAGVLPGTFNAYIGTSPEHVSTAVQHFLAEMRRIQDERVTQAELKLARDYVIGAFALSFQRASRRVTYMINAERYHLPEDNLERLPREIAAVSTADVQRAAQRHLHPDACCLAASGPITERELRAALAGPRRRRAARHG